MKENAYIQAFLDITLKFCTNSPADLNNFLDWWDEEGYKKKLFFFTRGTGCNPLDHNT